MEMRVLHVVRNLSTEAGAVTVLLRGLLEELDRAGIRSKMLSMEGAGDEFTMDRDGGGSPFDDSGDSVEWADVVHFHGWGFEGVRRIARSVRQGGKRFVVSPLGALSVGPMRPAAWRVALDKWFGLARLARSAAVIAACHELEAQQLRRAGFGDRVRVVGYGHRLQGVAAPLETEVVLPAPLPGRTLLVLGSIAPVEGCVALLKAFAELGPEADGWHVVFAGRDPGTWKRMLEPAIERKGGANRVTFCPAEDVETQRAWLARAEVLVAPSLTVRAPVSVLQAVAAEVPVVATVPAAPDGLADVIQVCAAERGALREGLGSVLRMSIEARAQRAKAARAKAAAKYDWSVLLPNYVELYRQLAMKNRSGSRRDAAAA